MATLHEFHLAAQRLLGDKLFHDLIASRYSPHDFCREIAECHFVGSLQPGATQQDDLALIRAVATRLWRGDGVTGLEPSVQTTSQ